MRIEIKNFCALKNVEFTLNPGINVIAGKNGSGKSQLLMALAHQYGNQTLSRNGFENIQVKTVIIEPRPRKILWRQPIRNVGSGTRGHKYATLAPPSYAARTDHLGYTWGVDERYNNLHNSLTNMYVAGNLVDSTATDRENWLRLTASFQRIFGKEFVGEYTSRAGRVGIIFENNEICRFDTLSTGELEFLSLFSDILTEPDVDLFIIDEIDAHFHPNLQRTLIAELEEVAAGKNILLTTHSPALMLSVPPSNLFYLRHSSEVGAEENQVTRLVEDMKLLNSISEMYAGFIGDIRIGKHFFESVNHELLVYADQCLTDSVAIGAEKLKDSDSQTSILRALLLTECDEVIVEEIGVGKGRLLAAFNSLTDPQLAKISYIGVDINEGNLKELDAYAERIGLKQKLRSFRCTNTIDEANKADLCILANVLHEIGPDQMCNFLSQVIASQKMAHAFYYWRL
jgi:predicted ATPase